jgi:hypothetical protein
MTKAAARMIQAIGRMLILRSPVNISVIYTRIVARKKPMLLPASGVVLF